MNVSDTHYTAEHNGRSVRYPRVSRIVQRARRNFAHVDPDTLRAAMERGTAVHAMLELINGGGDGSGLDEASVHPLLRGYLESARKWNEVMRPYTVGTERMMVSHRWRYGGRTDWVCRLQDKHRGLWIIDYKSGAEDPADSIQTAAYWTLYQERYKPTEPVFRGALYPHKDGRMATFHPHTNTGDFSVFLSYRTIYEWERSAYGTDDGTERP